MKRLFKEWLKNYLRILAAAVLKKYQPRIIAITGSTGKTTTKEAIFTAIAGSDNWRNKLIAKTTGNLNTEFGIPASIIDPSFVGTPVGDKMRLSTNDVWKLTGRAFKLLFTKADYPELWILELGADKPGDITHFMSFIQPEVGILTNIGDVHLEFFGSKANLVEEKRKLITGIKPGGLAILNKDDEFTNLIARNLPAKVIFISAKTEADFRATDIALSGSGIRFYLAHADKSLPVAMPVYGRQFVYAGLSALAVADYLGVPLAAAVHSLSKLKLPSARFEKIELGKLTLIDDTYNANPTSMAGALESLASLGLGKRKVAILGDMRELGSAYEKGHQEVGRIVAKTADFLISIGAGGELIRQTAILSGMPASHTVGFAEAADQSQEILLNYLRDNDIVLVKGSRAVHLDKIANLIKEKYSHE